MWHSRGEHLHFAQNTCWTLAGFIIWLLEGIPSMIIAINIDRMTSQTNFWAKRHDNELLCTLILLRFRFGCKMNPWISNSCTNSFPALIWLFCIFASHAEWAPFNLFLVHIRFFCHLTFSQFLCNSVLLHFWLLYEWTPWGIQFFMKCKVKLKTNVQTPCERSVSYNRAFLFFTHW